MTIHQAIGKAIEGGYDTLRATGTVAKRLEMDDSEIFLADFLIDPLFWQALGKAMGWGHSKKSKAYIQYWYRLIDRLADGGTIESYFEDLETN